MPRVKRPAKPAKLRLRLYIAGQAENSLRALANLTALCAEHFPASHDLEIVDMLEHPQRALSDGVLVTPTLLKLQPAPARRIVGSLSDTRLLLSLLEGS